MSCGADAPDESRRPAGVQACRIAIENDNNLYVLLFIIYKFVDILDHGYGLKFELVFEPRGKGIAYYGAYSVFDFLFHVVSLCPLALSCSFRPYINSTNWHPTGYIRSGAVIPINSRDLRKTIWADSTSFSRARVRSLSSAWADITRQFS